MFTNYFKYSIHLLKFKNKFKVLTKNKEKYIGVSYHNTIEDAVKQKEYLIKVL